MAKTKKSNLTDEQKERNIMIEFIDSMLRDMKRDDAMRVLQFCDVIRMGNNDTNERETGTEVCF